MMRMMMRRRRRRLMMVWSGGVKLPVPFCRSCDFFYFSVRTK
jgi:hypothetical protein